MLFQLLVQDGHINPGLAIANKIKKEDPNSEIVFIGTNRGLENDLVPRAGYQLKIIEAYGFQKEISIENFRNVLKTFSSKKDVKRFFEEFKPDIVIGTGGYICVPVFGVAIKCKIPTLLHESNAFPGRSVKLYAKKVDRVLVGFKETKECLGNAKNVVVTGTPTKVRKLNITYTEKLKILNNLGIKNDLPIVLIFGGSQGAKKINDSVYNIIKNNLNKKYQIVWATGPKQFDIIKTALKNDSIDIEKLNNVKILPYIYNMDEMMNISDLLICRSGAMTITEISIVGKPAIFIPLPSKMANRQEDNAKVLEKIGAAKIISNNVVDYQNLSEMIDFIIQDRIRLEEMGKIAKTLAPENTEEKIYNEIKSILH
ncbi:MAG: undecaprenyldiphospho-muramoylpentapeptide beta-N-acetylglucosaminyltransferase [Clostridia bacterium]|nr:undecaprenyldiphospho-muramoylpentapeptide beta-N-acetylglucosaminyltransferase [Clostridia bacterium]